MDVRPIFIGRCTIEEANSNQCESEIDVGVALIVKGEETIGENGVDYEEWNDIETKEEESWFEEFEVD